MAKRNLAELKIPASSAFIPVAKRVATTLGGQLGFSLVDLDELTIALTQACDSAIAAANDLGSPADLKLTYFATDRALASTLACSFAPSTPSVTRNVIFEIWEAISSALTETRSIRK